MLYSFPPIQPPSFHGDPKIDDVDVSEFIQKFNVVFGAIPDHAKIHYLHLTLEGTAADWLSNYTGRNSYDCSWDRLIKEFSEVFNNRTCYTERYDIMKARIQERNEPFRKYAFEKLRLIAKLNRKISESETCDYIWKGMETSLALVTVGQPKDNVTEFIRDVSKIESDLLDLMQRRKEQGQLTHKPNDSSSDRHSELHDSFRALTVGDNTDRDNYRCSSERTTPQASRSVKSPRRDGHRSSRKDYRDDKQREESRSSDRYSGNYSHDRTRDTSRTRSKHRDNSRTCSKHRDKSRNRSKHRYDRSNSRDWSPQRRRRSKSRGSSRKSSDRGTRRDRSWSKSRQRTHSYHCPGCNCFSKYS